MVHRSSPSEWPYHRREFLCTRRVPLIWVAAISSRITPWVWRL